MGPPSADTIGWITFLTLLANMAWTAYREERGRRWAIEDAERLAKKVEEEARAVKQDLNNQTAELTRAIDHHSELSTNVIRELRAAPPVVLPAGVPYDRRRPSAPR